ncbi:MAG: wax ester/triacylglycerol synthase family O-acyltransferase [Gammaproteobacteria bacterium]|nr:wax ester/triacylglycerol synthase family O-acyltransferase [Gammaproteobacteria bacterium]
MDRLSLNDAAFLYMETDKAPTHAATLQLFEVPAEKLESYVDDFKRMMFDRRYLVPYLTHSLRFVPGNIDHPVWVDDGTFDVDQHIWSVDVGGAGTMHDLEDTVARLHQQRIPLDSPMWRIVVILGLQDGRVAHYSAVHHACVDGMGGQQPLNLLSDPSPDTTWNDPPARLPEKEPSGASLYLQAINTLAKANIDQWLSVPSTLKTAGALINRAIDSKKSFGALGMKAPKTPFNVEIDSERTLAFGQIPLAEVKALSRALDCTVNDVFMAIAAGALRSFFMRRGELPAEPLIAGCPVSMRGSGDDSQNNQVSLMMVSLETHVEDPLTRLANIRESADIGKAVSADLFSSGSLDLHAFGLPTLMKGAIGLAERTHLTKRMPMPMNITISNVPGPKGPLYSNGSEMVAMYPVSLATHGAGVNLTVISYRGSMDIAVTAAACALAEPRELRDDLLAAHAELVSLVLAERESKTGEGPAVRAA